MSTVRRVAGAAAALALCVALTSCEYIASTIPEVPAPTPTAASKPAETAMQRQMRLDYEAAEKAYRTASAEQDRLALRRAVKASPQLRAVATGDYLDSAEALLKQLRRMADRTEGATKVVGVVGTGWKAKSVSLTACEDIRSVRYFDERGKDVTPRGLAFYVTEYKVNQQDDGRWRVADATTTQQPKSLEGQPCAD